MAFDLRVCSISWEQMDRISPNFMYAFILTRYTLGLLHIIFRTFVAELLPLIYSKISFPLNILRTNFDQTLYNYLYWRFLAVIFRKVVRELWPLIDVRITLPLNILRLSGLLLARNARYWSDSIVRFSDNSSYTSFLHIFIS